MARDPKIVIILGAQGMGKTLVAREMVRRYRARKGLVRVLDPSCQWEEGEYPTDAYENPKAIDDWIRNLTQGGRRRGPPMLLVCDDGDEYIPNHNGASPWRVVFIRNRTLAMDVIITAHRPQDIPKTLLAMAHELWLFNMDEPHALHYFSKHAAIKPYVGCRLPTAKFECIRFSLRPRLQPVRLDVRSLLPKGVRVES